LPSSHLSLLGGIRQMNGNGVKCYLCHILLYHRSATMSGTRARRIRTFFTSYSAVASGSCVAHTGASIRARGVGGGDALPPHPDGRAGHPRQGESGHAAYHSPAAASSAALSMDGVRWAHPSALPGLPPAPEPHVWPGLPAPGVAVAAGLWGGVPADLPDRPGAGVWGRQPAARGGTEPSLPATPGR
jgi:hypothetical protein